MSKFNVGDKAIIWSKTLPKYNGTVVILMEKLDKPINKMTCRVSGKPFHVFSQNKIGWRTEEPLTMENSIKEIIEVTWHETALRPYDPPSEHTPESLLESLRSQKTLGVKE